MNDSDDSDVLDDEDVPMLSMDNESEDEANKSTHSRSSTVEATEKPESHISEKVTTPSGLETPSIARPPSQPPPINSGIRGRTRKNRSSHLSRTNSQRTSPPHSPDEKRHSLPKILRAPITETPRFYKGSLSLGRTRAQQELKSLLSRRESLNSKVDKNMLQQRELRSRVQDMPHNLRSQSFDSAMKNIQSDTTVPNDDKKDSGENNKTDEKLWKKLVNSFNSISPFVYISIMSVSFIIAHQREAIETNMHKGVVIIFSWINYICFILSIIGGILLVIRLLFSMELEIFKIFKEYNNNQVQEKQLENVKNNKSELRGQNLSNFANSPMEESFDSFHNGENAYQRYGLGTQSSFNPDDNAYLVGRTSNNQIPEKMSQSAPLLRDLPKDMEDNDNIFSVANKNRSIPAFSGQSSWLANGGYSEPSYERQFSDSLPFNESQTFKEPPTFNESLQFNEPQSFNEPRPVYGHSYSNPLNLQQGTRMDFTQFASNPLSPRTQTPSAFGPPISTVIPMNKQPSSFQGNGGYFSEAFHPPSQDSFYNNPQQLNQLRLSPSLPLDNHLNSSIPQRSRPREAYSRILSPFGYNTSKAEVTASDKKNSFSNPMKIVFEHVEPKEKELTSETKPSIPVPSSPYYDDFSCKPYGAPPRRYRGINI